MSYENLKLRALTVRDYLIKCQTMAMFASIRDIKNKEVWQLRKLRAMGINGLSIGVESGDDETLALANKGYTSADTKMQGIMQSCSVSLIRILFPWTLSRFFQIQSFTRWHSRACLYLPKKKSVSVNCKS